MKKSPFEADLASMPFDEIILQQGELISDKLNMLRMEQYPPNAEKGLRQFSLAEVAYFLGVTQSNIKKLHLEGKGPEPTTSSSGRRTYTAAQMLELREYLDKHGRAGKSPYVPHRRDGEELHVISVVNFKGGSGRCHIKQSERENDQIAILELIDLAVICTRPMRANILNVTEPL